MRRRSHFHAGYRACEVVGATAACVGSGQLADQDRRSDHLPMWIEFGIDDSDSYLEVLIP